MPRPSKRRTARLERASTLLVFLEAEVATLTHRLQFVRALAPESLDNIRLLCRQIDDAMEADGRDACTVMVAGLRADDMRRHVERFTAALTPADA